MKDTLFSLAAAHQQEYQFQKVIDCNQYTKKFGLSLSEKEVKDF